MVILKEIQSIIVVIGAIIAFLLMRKVKDSVLQGTVDQSSLTGKEKLYVWLLCFLSPVLAGLFFYYGWKKVLPAKAKSANTISLGAFLILIIIYFGYKYLSGGLVQS